MTTFDETVNPEFYLPTLAKLQKNLFYGMSIATVFVINNSF
jgi:hypothetical protein